MLPVILAVFVGCFILERLFPGWKLPAVPTWTIRVLAVSREPGAAIGSAGGRLQLGTLA